MSTSDANIILTPATFARMMNAVKVVESLRGAGVNAIPGMGATFNRRQPTPRNQNTHKTKPIFVQITTAANSSGVAGVKRYDGTTQSGDEFFVRVVSHAGVNEKLWVATVSPNANVSDPSSNKVPWMEFTSNATFRVKVTQVGGSAGSASAYCSYTYDVKDAATGAITLASAQSVLWARPLKAACITAGANGIAEIVAGTLALISVDEQFKTTACS